MSGRSLWPMAMVVRLTGPAPALQAFYYSDSILDFYRRHYPHLTGPQRCPPSPPRD